MLTRNSNLANMLLGGPFGLCLAIIIYAAMAVCSFTIHPDIPLDGSLGVCLPSPNEWDMSPNLSFGINICLTALCVLLAIGLNARFNIVPGTGLLYAVTFLVTIGAIPWIDQRLSSAIIITTVVLVCTHLLFALYGRRHAAQGMCVIFSLLSWGSMVQYAFVLIIPLFLLGAIFLNILRLRELVGIILGILCPYWIMLGLGVISIDSIGLPQLTNLFKGFTAPGLLFYLMLGQGIISLLTLILTASNAMAPSMSGQQHRSYLSFLNLMSIAMVWFMLFDSTNLLAYTGTLALCFGYQTALFAANPRNKLAYLPVVVALPAMIAIFILILK
ncbi:MAG: hypothetical protein NC217_00700 [Muribaculaceae bacterium]|nr:hypothetical protein [Muribaculaceae bacterium]